MKQILHIKKMLHSIKNVFTLKMNRLLSKTQKDLSPKAISEIQDYRKKIKVLDVFNFYNELETLDIRLNVLNEHVDFFVLVESTLTHSGLPKELYFKKNKHLFKNFEHKIIHFIINDPLKSFEDAKERLVAKDIVEMERAILKMTLSSDNIPQGGTSYLRDFFEKECARIPLAKLGLSDDDICFVSDLDEIWNPESPIDYRKNDIFKFRQLAYSYYLNNRSTESWVGTIATKYKNIKNSCLNHLRTQRKMRYTFVKNGGWHFTFQGGEERVKTKIESTCHQEVNNEAIKAKIKDNFSNNSDVIGRNFKFWVEEKDLPHYLLNNKEKYIKLFK